MIRTVSKYRQKNILLVRLLLIGLAIVISRPNSASAEYTIVPLDGNAYLPSSLAYDVESSSDGQIVVAGTRGHVFKSTDAGETWETILYGGRDEEWQAIALSEDGEKIIAGKYGAGLYISNDGGETWTVQEDIGEAYWVDIDMSADSQDIVVSTIDDPGYIFISHDGGTTFEQNDTLGEGEWLNIAISDDGQVIYAGDNAAKLYVSTDSGTTWTELTDLGDREWEDVSMSPDAETVIATIVGGGSPRYTIDGGDTWSSFSIGAGRGTASIVTTAINADSSIMYAAENCGALYKSTDQASSWSVVSNPDVCTNKIAVDDSGQYVVLAYDGQYESRFGSIGFSSDAGVLVNFNPNSNFGDWTSLATIASTSKLYTSEHTDWLRIAETATSTMFIKDGDGDPQEYNWTKIDVSADDSLVAAIHTTNDMYLSTDGGLIWEQNTWLDPSYVWIDISVSGDGSKIFAIDDLGKVYITTDEGATFDQIATVTSSNSNRIASNFDGSRLIVGPAADNLHIFSDDELDGTYDDSEITSEGSSTWLAVEYAGKADTVIAIDGNGELHLSLDDGETWTMPSIGAGKNAASISDNGQRIFLASDYYPMYSLDAGETWESIETIGEGYDLVAASPDLSRVFISYKPNIVYYLYDTDLIILPETAEPDPTPTPTPAPTENGSGASGGVSYTQSPVYLLSQQLSSNIPVPQTPTTPSGTPTGLPTPLIIPLVLQNRVFSSILSYRSQNPTILTLQQFLNLDPQTRVAQTGAGSPGKETSFFGPATRQAVQKFQLKYGIVSSPRDPGYGVVGPKTRAKINELLKSQ